MPTDRALDLNRNSYRNSLSHVNQIPPRSNGSSTRSSNVGVSRPDTTNSQPTIWRSSNSHQSEFGYALTSPRPSTTLADLFTLLLFAEQGPGIPGSEISCTTALSAGRDVAQGVFGATGDRLASKAALVGSPAGD